jgi:hypothetical protein
MRLEEICRFDWHYDESGRVPDTGYVIVRPYGGEEGSAYGEGSGTVSGRIEGNVVWSNHPHRRSDGTMLPDAHGLIITHDGARILFALQGRTVFSDDGMRGGQNLIGTFESDDVEYRWLNDVVLTAEGVIVPGENRIEIRVYAAINELL